MAKVSTEKFVKNEGEISLSFSFDVHVSANGFFYAYLPESVIEKFELYGLPVRPGPGRNSPQGYYTAETKAKLESAIRTDVLRIFERELVSETRVIKYAIETHAWYCLTPEGEPVPNGTWVSNYQWQSGTIGYAHYSDKPPFFLKVAARLLDRKIYRFKNGHTVTEYVRVDSNLLDPESEANAYWLAGISEIYIGFDKAQKIQ